ncbi:MAG TPA: decarboxylating 6-phosphogluconate dehydrogenase [Woeseiaceae bacterium]|nr:decarboxylating 6-phosphogluconate dehydrogenase [Woeseiaceae bacterium]
MNIGVVGAGKMGGNMAKRWQRGGAGVCVFDRSAEALRALAGTDGIRPFGTLADLVAALPAPRLLWLMLPTGAPTEQTIVELSSLLENGDLVVDGANAHYRESQRNAKRLAENGIEFVDAGVSGGIWGLENGYGLMLGGSPAATERILPLVRILAPAPDRGWVHCGPVGAGHFAKMVHNGIEYGLMQAYAEGFALLAAREDLELPLADIAEAWCHGTVIRSWLLELTADVLQDRAALDSIAAEVADSGEGRWTAQEAIDLGIPTPVISAALMTRFSSQHAGDFAARLLAMLRNSFGGHALPRD